MNKKFLAVLLIIVISMTIFTSCNEKYQALTECGEKVISLMVEMLESNEYKSLYNLPAAYDDQVKRLRDGDYSKSIAVYELLFSEEELLNNVLDADFDKSAFSKELYDYICSSTYTSFASRINQANGAEALTISSVFTAQLSFANNNFDTNKIYLYIFENGSPIAVTFVSDGNNSLRAVGHFIINDNFIATDINGIKESCEALGINDVTVIKQ